jgi:hypothetical protein
MQIGSGEANRRPILARSSAQAKKDIYAALNLYRDCFKHLGKTWEERKDDQAILNQFDDSMNEYLLYVCVEDYLRLRGSSPFLCRSFTLGFVSCTSIQLAPPVDVRRLLPKRSNAYLRKGDWAEAK